MSAGEPGSVVRRMLLGSQLRRLREARGITREAAGYSIRASESKISRMELGRVSFKTRDVEDLLTLYGITDEAERQSLLSLAREANVAGWWHSYSDVLPNWFPTYVGLEAPPPDPRLRGSVRARPAADRGVRPRGGPARHEGASADDVERRVALRLERQKYLLTDSGPEFHIVLDEAALRRPYGGREVMRGQLQHLIDISERPNVRLQVMPFSFGGHSGESGAFTILSFPESDLSDVVYLEQLTSALYLDKREDVAQYEQALKELQQDSPGPDESRDLLRGCSNSRDPQVG